MKRINYILSILGLIIIWTACSTPVNKNDIELIIEKEFVGKHNNVKLFTLKNEHGVTAQITNYGARIVSLFVQDKNNKFDDIVTGFATYEEYLETSEKYYGALVGRYGNRIAKGKFSIDGNEYTLEQNNGENSLHGGTKGMSFKLWEGNQKDKQTLELNYHSPDGEEGFPGNIDVTVMYELNNKNELVISYTASTDKATILNLTHHSFFNLHGIGKGSINDHILWIDADKFTPIDKTSIPTGVLASVKNTPFDFNKPTTIGKRITLENQQLTFGNGYDHNYVLNNANGTIKRVAKVLDPITSRTLEVYTNEPGMQFYTGNFLSGNVKGKGVVFKRREAFCLETQHFPNSPNQPNFPSTIVRPNEEYHSTCIYKFGIEE